MQSQKCFCLIDRRHGANVNLNNAVFYYLNLGDVSIDYANIHGLKIFGVEIGPLVEAELARKRGQ